MLTRLDMETALSTRVVTANNSGFVPPARLTQEIQDATTWAGGYHFWPSLQRARVSTAYKNTQSLNYDYYDYPVDVITDSISRLYIDGKKYFPKAFQDLLDYADSSNNPTVPPNPQNNYFANYGRQFFTFPSYIGTPVTGNLIAWGNIQHPPLLNPSDTTIFSRWDERGNEAIVKKAMSVILKRVDPVVANSEEQSAMMELELMWKKVTQSMQKAQRLNHTFLSVPDMFGFGSGQSTLGNFNIPVDVVNSF